jgi:hypothetical protein
MTSLDELRGGTITELVAESDAEWRAAAEANKHLFNWTAEGPVVMATGQVMPGWNNTVPLCTIPHGRLGDFNDEAAHRLAEYIALCSPENVLSLLDRLAEYEATP